MPALADTVMVFTARSPERIVREGGSQAWKLNPSKAKACKWLVCTQNRHHPDHNFSDATEPHGAAFMVGKISNITDRTDFGPGGRWKIEISEYALINKPNTWEHDRNPVRYTTLEDLGIDVDTLKFQPMSTDSEIRTSPEILAKQTVAIASGESVNRLTIPQAKQMLAATFGVSPDAIEITIRG